MDLFESTFHNDLLYLLHSDSLPLTSWYSISLVFSQASLSCWHSTVWCSMRICICLYAFYDWILLFFTTWMKVEALWSQEQTSRIGRTLSLLALFEPSYHFCVILALYSTFFSSEVHLQILEDLAEVEEKDFLLNLKI